MVSWAWTEGIACCTARPTSGLHVPVGDARFRMLVGYRVFRIISFFGSPVASVRAAYDLAGDFTLRTANRSERGASKLDIASKMVTGLPNWAVDHNFSFPRTDNMNKFSSNYRRFNEWMHYSIPVTNVLENLLKFARFNVFVDYTTVKHRQVTDLAHHLVEMRTRSEQTLAR
jgi:hypothetical protein